MTEIAPEPTPVPASASKSKFIVGGAALAAIIVLGGSAAFAWQQLSGDGTQPHDVLPARWSRMPASTATRPRHRRSSCST